MKCIGQDSSQLLILDLLTSLFNILVSTFPVLGMDGLILEKKNTFWLSNYLYLCYLKLYDNLLCVFS